MRAVEPTSTGFVERNGMHVFYEVYGDGDPTVFMLMPSMIVQSRSWKAQVPFLARFFRVVVIDPPGNGRSDPPATAADRAPQALRGDAWAVLDAVGADRAVLVGLCCGGGQAVAMAAEAPERVLGAFLINPEVGLAPPLPHKLEHDFDARLDTVAGWAKHNRHYWRRDWSGFAEFFFEEMFPEPHSTKQREDCVGWARQPGPELMLLDVDAPPDELAAGGGAEAAVDRVKCPVFVVTGSLDRCQNPARGQALADLTNGEHVVIEGGGHLPHARDPVKVNLLIRDFVRRVAPR